MLERVRRRTGLATVPGVLRIGAETAVHTTVWGVSLYAKGLTRVARAALDPDSAAQLADDLATATGNVAEAARVITRGTPAAPVVERWGLPVLERARATLASRGNGGVAPMETETQALRRAGEELLRRSRDVWSVDSHHPAYARMLRELAPDEARILVHLLKDGPQPCVDVVRGGVGGFVQTERELARGLTMIGDRASVRLPAAVPQYLNNLTRLGLIWTSNEPVSDLLQYQVVEVQQSVLDALHSVRRAKTVRRSIHLTPFGQDFARVCFADAEEIAELPAHEAPPDAATESS